MVDDLAGAEGVYSHTGRTMKWWQQIGFELSRAWWRVAQKLPRLVWPGDELDVVVTFSQEGLREGLELNQAFSSHFGNHLAEAERVLRDAGVEFDTGSGLGGRDWEWDFSLRGPISVRFKRRAKYPERRLARQKPKLVVNNGASS